MSVGRPATLKSNLFPQIAQAPQKKKDDLGYVMMYQGGMPREFVRRLYNFTPETVELIDELQRLLTGIETPRARQALGLGLGFISKRQVVELAIKGLYDKNRWRGGEDE